MATVTLFRPVGKAELELIRGSGFRAFPPRLQGQPFFYPVLTREYAEQIAREWNTRDPRSGLAGYVLRFEVRAEYLAKFQTQQVGGAQHLEYWVPAGELEEFNRNLVGKIEVVGQFSGRAEGQPPYGSRNCRSRDGH